MGIRWRWFVCCALLVVAFAGCRPKVERASVAMPALSLNFSSMYVAEGLGLWKAEGLEVKLDTVAGVQSTNALIAGDVDFATVTSAQFLRANARGQKLIAIANAQDRITIEIVVSKTFADGAHFDPAASPDDRMRALKKARIAVDAPNGFPNTFVRYAAKKAGLDPDRDVVITPIAPPAMAAALKSGQIDAIVMSQPWPSVVRKNGGVVTVASSGAGDFPELVPFNSFLLVTRPGLCESKAAMCKKMVAGLQKAVVVMLDKPDEAAAEVKRRFDKTDPKIVDETFKQLLAGTPRTVAISEPGFVHAQDYLVTAGILKNEEKFASFKELYTNAYVN